PSDVANMRPSAAVTTADSVLVAWTADKSPVSGKTTRENVRPSVLRNTTPPRPTSQQMVSEGADTPVRSEATPVGTGSHVAPLSGDRWSLDPVIRQRTVEARAGETFAAAIFCAAVSADFSSSRATAGGDAAGALRLGAAAGTALSARAAPAVCF